ncbi:hypothetical protein L6452_02829 [Arctium lappa]|uniref:Uncharacterized protein n=1 Tax=Arctium lappa TaxID=4217 RepID=A0ACB9FKH3_ARCLA|nr:hypothetical protein L6452_02829 [Arctium lappa]
MMVSAENTEPSSTLHDLEPKPQKPYNCRGVTGEGGPRFVEGVSSPSSPPSSSPSKVVNPGLVSFIASVFITVVTISVRRRKRRVVAPAVASRSGGACRSSSLEEPVGLHLDLTLLLVAPAVAVSGSGGGVDGGGSDGGVDDGGFGSGVGGGGSGIIQRGLRE